MTIPEAMLSIALTAGNPTPVEARPCYTSVVSSTASTVTFNPNIDTTEINSLQQIRIKITNFRNIKKSDFIEEKPSLLAEEKSLELLEAFKDNGIKIQNTLAMADGGISFDFFVSSCYYAIEIYNDGDIVYSKQRQSEKSIIKDLSFEEIKDELYAIKPYGD